MIQTLKQNPKILIFGLLTAFFSGPGQTFLVSLFAPAIGKSFDLSQAQFGGIYSAATLLGAIALPFLGRMLDRMELLKFTLFMGTCLSLGCFTLSFTHSILGVLIGLFMIRSFGHGALSLISSTTTAKFFHLSRGTALSITTLGHPLASACFPVLVTFWIFNYGWRSGWLFLALLILLMFLPIIFFLLKGQKLLTSNDTPKEHTGLSKQKLFKDPLFYFATFAGSIPPFVLTGLFLYQILIGQWKGWSISLMAAAFIVFSLFRAGTSLVIGPMIDKFSAKRMLKFHIIPLSLAIITLLYGTSIYWVFPYLMLCGITIGFGMPTKAAFWAESYGTDNLGSIKGINSFFELFATALSPVILGVLFDLNISFEIILISLLVICFIGLIAGRTASNIAVKRDIQTQFT